VRKICQFCKKEFKLDKTATAELAKAFDASRFEKLLTQHAETKKLKNDGSFYQGAGCHRCGQTGYKGRLSIAEAIHVTRSLKDIIAKGFDRQEVEVELAKQKFITMEQDGVIKALLGLTSIEEIMRVSKM